jgi:hypothetical protein
MINPQVSKSHLNTLSIFSRLHNLWRLAVRVGAILRFQSGEVLLNCSRLTFGLGPCDLVWRLAVVTTGISLHDAGVHGKPFALDQTSGHARCNDTLNIFRNLTLQEAPLIFIWIIAVQGYILIKGPR